MAASALYLALIFVGLGLATSLLVAVHDAIAAHLERRAARSLVDGGGGGVPLPLPAPRQAPRLRPSPRLVLVGEGGVAERSPERPAERGTERPAWLEAARRDVAHR